MSTDTLTFRPIEDGDIEDVVALWQRCDLTRPWNDPAKDIAFARAQPNADILLGILDGRIAASVMVGHDGHRGIVYYVAVDPDHRRKGLGRQVMQAAEAWLVERGVWKLNLVVRPENEGVRSFYEQLGYEVEPRLNMARRLIDQDTDRDGKGRPAYSSDS
ncbi:GNAT family acetyltransferase [Kaustia mangrovi]|uniref:GNAT family acetyltransferase n=1 Tax=Kaustia mangrovi TaxID=2593653 RepID=A0A7S8C2B7_9HYPH|nr:GNAT family acetyltransferase [Kaustia mangrovi]QPC42080.1 GNAT family acetyltransferase [Kaustia mangrovi]